jgi:hypothetical protein
VQGRPVDRQTLPRTWVTAKTADAIIRRVPDPSTRDDVTRRLAATGLAGAPLAEVPLPDGTSTWVVDLRDGDLPALWAQARDALADVALHPVGVTTWGAGDWGEADLFSRFYYGNSLDQSPEAVIARSHTLSVADAARAFASPSEWAVSNWADVVDHHLRLTEHDYGSVPDPALAADVPAGDELELERRLLAWEESVTPTHPPATSESFSWYEPRPHQPVGLVLLPVSEPCDAAAYLSFFGADGDDKHDALARLMRDWQGRFAAHLVASWGTMLQFVVASPPETLDEAFDLAALHAQVAPCTVVLPGEGVRQLARHLWRGERWFLHERP